MPRTRSGTTVTPSRGPLAGRTFASQQAYRSALAQLEGFASDYQRRQALSLRKERQALARLTDPQRRARQRALEAVGYLRRGGTTLTDAARRAGTTPASVKRYAADALLKDKGAYRARARDRALREMSILTLKGRESVWVRSSTDASLLGKYSDAVRHYSLTGDDSRLRPFRGRSIIDAYGLRWDFLTDKRELKRLGNAGELSFESIYAVSA